MSVTSTTTDEPEIVHQDIPVPAVTSANEIESLAERFAIEAQADLALANGVQVTDAESYEQAGALRVAIDRKRKGGEGVLELVTAPLYRRWKDFRALLSAPVETRAQALKVLSDKRLAYERQQQEIADRLRRESEERARQEQARLDKLALERAQRAEARGDTEKAQAILDSVPQVAPAPIPETLPQKTKGVATVTYWFAGLVGSGERPGTAHSEERRRQSLLQLVTAVAAGEVPLDAVTVNDKWLGKTAAALRDALKYPGVEVWSERREKSTGR